MQCRKHNKTKQHQLLQSLKEKKKKTSKAYQNKITDFTNEAAKNFIRLW